jgi:hypothetical protein
MIQRMEYQVNFVNLAPSLNLQIMYTKKIKKLYHKFLLLFNPPEKATRDIIYGKVYLGKPNWLAVGNKVICDRGIAHIKEIKNNWLVLTYGYSQVVEKKTTSVFQYIVHTYDPYSRERKELPLSFADYEYVDQNALGQRLEMNITKRKYAKMTDEERERHSYLYHFNAHQGGSQILKKLHEEGLIEGTLLTIKTKKSKSHGKSN